VERFEWRGRQVAWQSAGSGPPVVFCHGTPFSSRVWAPFAQALADDYSVHLWDMPGYGQSSKDAAHAVDFGVQGELLADLIRAWGMERPHVVAHDFGGAVALRAHLLHGAAFASLMLVDVVAVPPTGSPFFRFVQRYPDVMPQLPAYIHAAILPAYIQGASHRGLCDDDVRELIAPWTTEEGQAAFYRQIAQTDERYLEEIESRLGDLEIPVRIVWGAQDDWIAPDVAHRLRDLIPGSMLRLVEGAGHLVQYDAGVALASELRSWLAAQTQRAGPPS
jgi:pimeloyl-ACP methyl ester carboxylesterase